MVDEGRRDFLRVLGLTGLALAGCGPRPNRGCVPNPDGEDTKIAEFRRRILENIDTIRWDRVYKPMPDLRQYDIKLGDSHFDDVAYKLEVLLNPDSEILEYTIRETYDDEAPERFSVWPQCKERSITDKGADGIKCSVCGCDENPYKVDKIDDYPLLEGKRRSELYRLVDIVTEKLF